MASKEFPATFVEGFHDKEAVSRMRYRPLGRTGMVVSILSLGASSLGSVFRATNDEEAVGVVQTAVRKGINFIDTAAWYGHGKSETILGKALAGIPRESYYIATKACRYLPEADKMFDFSAERTLRSIDESLERLQLDYVDLMQACTTIIL
jgi:aryl-alcohol dehydrogenase-like predicted oxidoreductase